MCSLDETVKTNVVSHFVSIRLMKLLHFYSILPRCQNEGKCLQITNFKKNTTQNSINKCLWFKTIWFNLPQWKKNNIINDDTDEDDNDETKTKEKKRCIWKCQADWVSSGECERLTVRVYEWMKSDQPNEWSAMTLKLGCNEHNRLFNSSSSATSAYYNEPLKIWNICECFYLRFNWFLSHSVPLFVAVCYKRTHTHTHSRNDDS